VSAVEDDTQRAIDALERVGSAATCESSASKTGTEAQESRPPDVIQPFVPPLRHHFRGASAHDGPRSGRQNLLDQPSLRSLAEQLRSESCPRRRLRPLPLAFVGLAAIGIGTFVASRLAGRPRVPEKSLLVRYEEELAKEGLSQARQPEMAVVRSPPPGTTPAATANVAQRTRVSSAEESMPRVLRGPNERESAPSGTDAKAIQHDLEQAFGTSRPTIPGPAASQPAMPSWVKGVQVAEAKPAASAEKKLGGRYGDHLRFQLRSNLDSRLCGSGAVEAVLVRPYLVNGAIVLPPRTLVYGQCSAQGGRFLITFTRLRLPDGSEAQFEGVAMDVSDGKPGLLANRRMSAERSDSRPSIGGEIAKGAASTVLSAATAPAGLPGQVANSAGQTAISTRSQESTTSEDLLLLDAGAGIDVFVRQGF